MILFLFLIPNFSSGQYFDIEMEGNLKKGAYDDTKLLLQNITLKFGNVSICRENNCRYEIQNGTLDIFGNYVDIDGTLKIEVKSKFDPQTNSTFFDYFDLSGSFRLDSSKDNQISSEELLRKLAYNLGLNFFIILVGIILIVDGLISLISGTIIFVHDRWKIRRAKVK